jgi:cytoskeleton protein RodZ
MNEDTPLNDATDVVPEEVAQQPLEVIAPPSAGAQLKALRESRGWSIEQVANQLNLASRQIDALERDNYAALPGMVIVRGFIRTYAKLLNADAAPILAAIRDESGTAAEPPPSPRSVTSASFSETHLKDDNGRGFPLKSVIAVIAVLAVGAVAVFQGQRFGWKTERRAQEAKTNELAPVAVQEAPAAAQPMSEQLATSSPAASTEVPAAAQASQADAGEKAAEKAPAPAASGKNVLAIQVHQDSWVEIRRADNDKVVFSSLLKAGASESIELPAPVLMVVGNAAGVEVTLRGAPVDLKGNASNVARINLK